MSHHSISEEIREAIWQAQQIEITEFAIYGRLAATIGNQDNAAILWRIAEDEKRHAVFWAKYTGKNAEPKRLKVWLFLFIAKVLGLTFALKLLERNENRAMANYEVIARAIPEAADIIADEDRHENELLSMLSEERLEYVGSIVLGLNDALVELTGALAGLSFALQNSRLIGFAGLITGIAASLSMAASDYLSHKSRGETERALRSAAYTGTAYLITVILLVLPYLLGLHYFTSLAITLCLAILIIAGFNYYLAVAKDLSFRHRFTEMSIISLGVAAFTFFTGWALRSAFGIEA